MSLRKKFGTNKEVIEQGAWVDICENEDGTTCRIRVKRMNQQNPRYMKQMANHRSAFTGDHFNETKLSQMATSMIEVLISTVIVGWENMEDWTGGESKEGFPSDKTPLLPYSTENVRKTLIEFPDLSDLISEQAQEISTFQRQQQDGELKK